MAERGVPHRQAGQSGVLGTAVDFAQLPLLPFERQLCQLIGCSEKEYRQFTVEAIKRGKERPAAYAHVPDVENGFVVPILINLAIGIALSAIGMLLAPKPPGAPGAPGAPKQKQRESETGRTRFNAAFGFDGIQALAEYGKPIPILFGKYQQKAPYTTGGLSIEPVLVWSRMFSYGSHQGFKGLFLVGEQLEDSRPSVKSVQLGTGS